MTRLQAIEALERVLSRRPIRRLNKMLNRVKAMRDGELPAALSNEVKYAEFDSYRIENGGVR